MYVYNVCKFQNNTVFFVLSCNQPSIVQITAVKINFCFIRIVCKLCIRPRPHVTETIFHHLNPCVTPLDNYLNKRAPLTLTGTEHFYMNFKTKSQKKYICLIFIQVFVYVIRHTLGMTAINRLQSLHQISVFLLTACVHLEHVSVGTQTSSENFSQERFGTN